MRRCAVVTFMRRLIRDVGSLGAVALVVSIPLSCSSGKSPGGEGGAGANLPLVTPPVRAATPTGLRGSDMGSTHTKAVALHTNSIPSGVGVTPDGAAPPPPDSDASPGEGGTASGPGPGSDGGMGS